MHKDILLSVHLFFGGHLDQLTLFIIITQACNKGFVNGICKGKCFMTRHLRVKFWNVASDEKMNTLIQSKPGIKS